MQAQILILLVTLVKNLKLKILGVPESSKPPGKEKSDECFDASKAQQLSCSWVLCGALLCFHLKCTGDLISS